MSGTAPAIETAPARKTATVHEASREQFDRQAAHYNTARWSSWSDETLQRMLEIADPQPGWRVLDLATGGGFTARAFAERVASVVATDISTEMLAQAARRASEEGTGNIEWQEAAAESLPFDDGSFDLVTVRLAPHHFADVTAFARESARVLKRGGALVVGDTTVPDDDPEAADWQNATERERDPSHGENLSPERWRALLTEAGFAVDVVDALSGSIAIPLTPWLETAGCTPERAERVRRMVADAPESARKQFRIVTDPNGETHFAWQRVVLRAVKG